MATRLFFGMEVIVGERGVYLTLKRRKKPLKNQGCRSIDSSPFGHCLDLNIHQNSQTTSHPAARP